MQDELSLLIKLQQHDAGIDELVSKADALLPLIKSKNQKADDLKARLKSSKDSLSSHQVKKKELELEADSKEKLVQKHQSELNSLKSNDAYKAMLVEIQSAKEAVRKIEDDILAEMEAIEAAEREYKEREKQFKADEANMKKEVADLESDRAAILEEAKKRQAERDAFAQEVPVAVKSHYETLRQSRGGLAIVPLINNSCGGCHMSLTPNKTIEVKKAKTMVVCDSCSRILYLPHTENASPQPSSSDTETVATPKA